MRTKVKPAELAPMRNGQSSTMWLRADHIQIDPDTQRQLRPQWAKQIADTFDPNKLGIIHVSRRKDGFYAMDGQHRVWACIIRKEPERLLECKLYENMSKPAEAQLFDGLNDQKAVGAYDKFRVRLNYDPDVQAISALLQSVGLRLGLESKDGFVAAVDACLQVYNGTLFRSKEQTPWALARALRTLTGAWGKNRDAFSSVMIKAAGGVHLRYGDDIDPDHLARALGKFDGGPVAVASRAKIRREMTRGSLWSAVAEVMVDVYNKGRRKSALPPFGR